MQLFHIKIRQDWQELHQQRINEYLKLWRLIQLVVILSTVGNFIVAIANVVWPWGIILRLIFSSALFLVFSLWIIYRSQTNSFQAAILVAIGLVLAAIIAGHTSILPEINRMGGRLAVWPLTLILFVPIIGGAILIWSYRMFPIQMREFGFSSYQWSLNTIIGTATGGSLAFHFLLAAYLLSGYSDQNIFNLPVFLWTLFFRLGLGALGEEFLLRGVAFPLLFEKAEHSFWKAAWQVGFLNVMIYIVPILRMPDAFLGICMTVYLLIFSFATTFLRHRQGSLMACIASNVAFNVVIRMIIQW